MVEFLRAYLWPEPILPHVEGDGVLLRAPRMDDFEAWATLRERSRAFLSPWEPTWPADDLTRAAFRRRLRRYVRDIRADTAYPFFIFETAGNTLVGGATLSNIRRGVSQSASLGYWMGAPYARRGLMTQAVRTIAAYAFTTLRLHRVEAACVPTNIASIRLLEKTGFRREGLARAYLCINGAWSDHILFARLADAI